MMAAVFGILFKTFPRLRLCSSLTEPRGISSAFEVLFHSSKDLPKLFLPSYLRLTLGSVAL